MLEFSEYIQSAISPDIIHTELENGFLYYKNLNPILQKRFVDRLSFFICEKRFVPRQGLKMTDKIRIIVSACSVQTTFGLDEFILQNFKYIVVYPDIYESPMTKKMHRGETNLNGFICLSWKHILEGLENPHDNYNLGIHEWMHALRFNGINFEQTDYFFDGYINKWVAGAMSEYNDLRTGKKNIFRRYGANNIHEFLSVTTEHFFESPDEFQKVAPEFFTEMCILLNQIPHTNGSAQIGVREQLLNAIPQNENNKRPLLILEASFFRTILNMGYGILPFVVTLFVLFSMQNAAGITLSALLILGAAIKMNSLYFSIKFYEDFVYLQKGFITSFATRLTVPYKCLIKMEIYNGDFDGYSTGTVFQIHYYGEKGFSVKAAYCSAIDVPQHKIIELLKKKKVLIFWPS